MDDLLFEMDNQTALIILNRTHKSNALNHDFIKSLHHALHKAIKDPNVRVILFKAQGPHFCAGADINSMQHAVELNEQENIEEAMVLAQFLFDLHQCPKPTMAVVQGSAFGGGAGLVAACDVAIAAQSARFCFSEVKLGLIPAIISPYVIEAIGARAARVVFMSAELFDAPRALSLGLVQHCVPNEALESFALKQAQQISANAPEAVKLAKQLVQDVAGQDITASLVRQTATLIAQRRVSAEGQQGLSAFLNKKPPQWN